MKLRVEKKILKILGATVRTLDEQGQIVCRADQKAFKLKELIHFYADDEKTKQLFSVKARKILDFGTTYDIFNPAGQIIASLRRKGVRSIFVQDTWILLDAQEQEIGMVEEESGVLAVLRRYIDYVALFSPQKFNVLVDGQNLGHMHQNYNPFTVRYDVEFSDQAVQRLGYELLLAIPNLITIIEGRQS